MGTIQRIGRKHHGRDEFGTRFSDHAFNTADIVLNDGVFDTVLTGDSNFSQSQHRIFDTGMMHIGSTVNILETLFYTDLKGLFNG